MQGMTATTRLPGESAKAYAAWRCYLDMGSTRSLVRVSQELGKSTVILSRWSVAWKWQERLLTAAAEDAEIERKAREAVAFQRAKERVRREEEAEDQAYELYKKGIDKLTKMLAWPLSKQVVDTETGLTTVMPVQWRLGDVARVGGWTELLRKVMTGRSITVADVRAANGNQRGTAIIPTAAGTPGVIIHIEGGEDDEDEIEYLPTNVTQMPAQIGSGGPAA